MCQSVGGTAGMEISHSDVLESALMSWTEMSRLSPLNTGSLYLSTEIVFDFYFVCIKIPQEKAFSPD